MLYVLTVLLYYFLVRFTLVRLCWYESFLIWFCGLDCVVLGKGFLIADVERMGAGGMDDCLVWIWLDLVGLVDWNGL